MTCKPFPRNNHKRDDVLTAFWGLDDGAPLASHDLRRGLGATRSVFQSETLHKSQGGTSILSENLVDFWGGQ